MAHNTRVRADLAAWSAAGVAVTPGEFYALDSNAFKSINGDDGGTWSPLAAIEIGGAGLLMASPIVTSGTGRVTSRYLEHSDKASKTISIADADTHVQTELTLGAAITWTVADGVNVGDRIAVRSFADDHQLTVDLGWRSIDLRATTGEVSTVTLEWNGTFWFQISNYVEP